jgi:hypothetical protein
MERTVTSDDKPRSAGKFRIGGPDELIFLMYERGDTPQTICERYGLSIDEVEAAIKRCRAQEKNASTDA